MRLNGPAEGANCRLCSSDRCTRSRLNSSTTKNLCNIDCTSALLARVYQRMSERMRQQTRHHSWTWRFTSADSHFNRSCLGRGRFRINCIITPTRSPRLGRAQRTWSLTSPQSCRWLPPTRTRAVVAQEIPHLRTLALPPFPVGAGRAPSTLASKALFDLNLYGSKPKPYQDFCKTQDLYQGTSQWHLRYRLRYQWTY